MAVSLGIRRLFASFPWFNKRRRQSQDIEAIASTSGNEAGLNSPAPFVNDSNAPNTIVSPPHSSGSPNASAIPPHDENISIDPPPTNTNVPTIRAVLQQIPAAHNPASTVPSTPAQTSTFTNPHPHPGVTTTSTSVLLADTDVPPSASGKVHPVTKQFLVKPDQWRDRELIDRSGAIQQQAAKELIRAYKHQHPPCNPDFCLSFWMASDTQTAQKTPHLYISCKSQTGLATVNKYCDGAQWLQKNCAENNISVRKYRLEDDEQQITQASQISKEIVAEKLTENLRGQCSIVLQKGPQFPYSLSIERHFDGLVSRCKLGGFIWLGKTLYGLGPGHFLDKPHGERPDETEKGGTGSKNAMSPTTLGLIDQHGERLKVDLLRPSNDTSLAANPTFNYDWLLVDVSKVLPRLFASGILQSEEVRNEAPPLLQADFDTSLQSEPDGPVTILLGHSASCQGVLNPTPATITLGSRVLDVCIIILDQSLPMGSSGAWVVHGGLLYGFVVAVCKSPPWAYMIPIRKAFENVEAILGAKPRVATLADLDSIAVAAGKSQAPSQFQMADPARSTPSLTGSRECQVLTDCRTRPVSATSSSASEAWVTKSSIPPRPVARQGPQYWKALRNFGRQLSHKMSRKRYNHASRNHECLYEHIGKHAARCEATQKGNLLQIDDTLPHDQLNKTSCPRPVEPISPFSIWGRDSQSSIQEVRQLAVAAEERPREAYKSCPAMVHILPSKVTFSLVLSFNGRRIDHNDVFQLKWLKNSRTFREVQDIAEMRLRATNTLVAGQAYIRSGTCFLFYGDFEKRSAFRQPTQLALKDFGAPFRRTFDFRTVESGNQWAVNIPSMVHEFCTTHRNSTFYLELVWEIAQLRPFPSEAKNATILMEMLLVWNRKSNWDNRAYVPKKALRTIMSRSLVWKVIHMEKELRTVLQSKRPEDGIAAYFWNTGWRLMAAVVDAGLPLKALLTFFRQGISDNNLPLQDTMRPADISVYDFGKLLLKQYAFIPHSFDTSSDVSRHTVIPEEVVIPVKVDEIAPKLGDGKTGEVWKVSIDEEHHNFGSRKMHFAVKRLRRRVDSPDVDGNREHEILNTLHAIRHDHLLVPLCSWQQGNTLHILFPCANLNLHQFLRRSPAPNLNRDLVLGMIDSLKNIADAVRFIHNLGPSGLAPIESYKPDRILPTHLRKGFHHDIKPSNILLYDRQDGSFPVWKLGDFGVTRISQAFWGTHDASGTTLSRDSKQAYGAPDHRLGYRAGQPYDIWSSGCIILECMIWMSGVEPHLDDFEQARCAVDAAGTFWYETGESVTLKPVILDRLAKLRKYAETRGVFIDLVNLTYRMLAIRPQERPDAPNMVSSLDAIFYQASLDLGDEDYYLAGRPTKRTIAAPSPSPSDMPTRKVRDSMTQTLDLGDLDLGGVTAELARTRAASAPSNLTSWNPSNLVVNLNETSKINSEDAASRTASWVGESCRATNILEDHAISVDADAGPSDDQSDVILTGLASPPRTNTISTLQSSEEGKARSRTDTEQTEPDLPCLNEENIPRTTVPGYASDHVYRNTY